MARSKIEWCDRTWNPITGCPGPLASPGCVNCYARRTAETRLRGRCGYDATDPFKITFHPERLKEPAKWKTPQRIFVGSMGDMFHPDVLYRDLDLVFAVAALMPRHEFMFLTKRVDLMLEYMTGERKNGDEGITSGAVYDAAHTDRQWRYFSDVPGWKTIRPYMPWQWPLSNVCLGATICNQKEADEKIPWLLTIPAAKHFVSIEPMLGPVNMQLNGPDGECLHALTGAYSGNPTAYLRSPEYNVPELDIGMRLHFTIKALDWVICGGETGPNARPVHPSWVQGLRDQCQQAGVPFFFKGWGDWCPFHPGQGYKVSPGMQTLWGTINKEGTFWRETTPWSGDNGDFEFSVMKIGKKRAGRLLDGREWHEMPQTHFESTLLF